MGMLLVTRNDNAGYLFIMWRRGGVQKSQPELAELYSQKEDA